MVSLEYFQWIQHHVSQDHLEYQFQHLNNKEKQLGFDTDNIFADLLHSQANRGSVMLICTGIFSSVFPGLSTKSSDTLWKQNKNS